MVKNVTSLTRNGLRDWLIQRISAVVIAAYFIFLFIFYVTHPNMPYMTWHTLFESNWVRIFSILVLLSILLHAWVGMWTVSTDYLKSTVIRLGFQLFLLLVSLSCLVWGIQILWGV